MISTKRANRGVPKIPQSPPLAKGSFHSERFVPDASWSLEDLETEITHEQTAVLLHERKLAIHTYRLGRALALARQKVSHGEWGPFLTKHNLSPATDCRARQLFDRAPSEEALKGMTIQEAYERYGISTGKDKSEKSKSREAICDRQDNTSSCSEDRSEVRDDSIDGSENDTHCRSGVGTCKGNGQDSRGSDKATLPAPPKEDPDSFGMRLAQLVSRAEWLAENIEDISPTDEERKHWVTMAEQAGTAIQTIIGAFNVE